MSSADPPCPADLCHSEDEVLSKVLALKAAGNNKWIGVFIEAFGHKLKGALKSRFNGALDSHDIDDVVGEWLRQMCESPGLFDPGRRGYIGYCYRRMFWIATQEIRRRQKDEEITQRLNKNTIRPHREFEDSTNVLVDTGNISPAQEVLKSIVQEGIERLATRQRQVVEVELIHGDALSRVEKGQLLGITGNTYGANLNKAKKKMKEHLAAYGYDPDTLEKNA